MRTTPPKPSIRTLLAGSDRRSSAHSKQALERFGSDPACVTALVELTDDADWLVSMRAIDLLEKACSQSPRLG
jgi:hypothetical protein